MRNRITEIPLSCRPHYYSRAAQLPLTKALSHSHTQKQRQTKPVVFQRGTPTECAAECRRRRRLHPVPGHQQGHYARACRICTGIIGALQRSHPQAVWSNAIRRFIEWKRYVVVVVLLTLLVRKIIKIKFVLSLYLGRLAYLIKTQAIWSLPTCSSAADHATKSYERIIYGNRLLQAQKLSSTFHCVNLFFLN